LTASPDRTRSAPDTGNSAQVFLRAADPATAIKIDRLVLEAPSRKTDSADCSGTNEPVQKPSLLRLSSFVATTVADIFAIFAVIPFVLLTGPSQTDTALSIALPVAIICAAPLLAAPLAVKLPKSFLALWTVGARLAIASSLFGSLREMQATATTIVLSLAFIWGFRMQEVCTSSLERTKSGKLILCALPMLTLLAVLKFFDQLQPAFAPAALSLYAAGLVTLGVEQIINRIRTTGNTIQKTSDAVRQPDAKTETEERKAFTTAAYEVLLSVMACVLPLASAILVMTDQGILAPTLRNDVTASLSGYSLGAFATALISSKYRFKITHLHMAFIVFLGVMLLSRTSILALSALLFTSMIAGSITMTVNHQRWQRPAALSLIVLTSYVSYLYLTPFQSTWMPIHALRMLVGNVLLVAIAALFVSTRGRATIITLARKLAKAKFDSAAFSTSSGRSD
jgi:uncharacterized membrane protein (DUF485 family)